MYPCMYPPAFCFPFTRFTNAYICVFSLCCDFSVRRELAASEREPLHRYILSNAGAFHSCSLQPLLPGPWALATTLARDCMRSRNRNHPCSGVYLSVCGLPVVLASRPPDLPRCLTTLPTARQTLRPSIRRAATATLLQFARVNRTRYICRTEQQNVWKHRRARLVYVGDLIRLIVCHLVIWCVCSFW